MLNLYAGDTKEIEIEIRDDDGALVELANFSSVKWILRKGSDVHITKTLDAGISDDGVVFLVLLVPADTQNLAGMYTQECEVTDISGNKSTVLVEPVFIEKTYIE
jgi:hypothetical protein